MKLWWRRQRAHAQDLFEQELARALERIVATPELGSLYEQDRRDDVEVRRLLMPKTCNHVYYAVTPSEIVVITVWGARRGRGPRV